MRGKDGATLRSHLEVSARRGSPGAAAALQGPPLPAGYAYLLDWFFELHGRRGSGMHGPAALTWGDFDAWARRTERRPTPWEFRVLGLLDDAFFAAVQDMQV